MTTNPIRERIHEIDEAINQLLNSGKKEILIRLEWEELARERYILNEQLDLIYKQIINRI